MSTDQNENENENGTGSSPAEARLLDFTEDLGRLLESAQIRARNWLDQRTALAEQLAQIRDTAQRMLTELTGGGADGAVAVTRPRRGKASRATSTKARGRTAPKAVRKKKSGMTPEGRARVAEAQRARWARIKAEREQ